MSRLPDAHMEEHKMKQEQEASRLGECKYYQSYIFMMRALLYSLRISLSSTDGILHAFLPCFSKTARSRRIVCLKGHLYHQKDNSEIGVRRRIGLLGIVHDINGPQSSKG